MIPFTASIPELLRLLFVAAIRDLVVWVSTSSRDRHVLEWAIGERDRAALQGDRASWNWWNAHVERLRKKAERGKR